MDEMDNKFPVPAKKPLFGEGADGMPPMPPEDETAPAADFVQTFESGDKAGNFTTVEVQDGEVLSILETPELESYAMDVLDGAPDDRGLQIGDTFEGENAYADASAEAGRLMDEYGVEADAADEDLVDMVDQMKGDTTVAEEDELAEAEAEPAFGQLTAAEEEK